jgi:ABC-type uncharacterized transport system permease subunit
VTLFVYLAAFCCGLAALGCKRDGRRVHLLFNIALVGHLVALVLLSQTQQGDIFYSRGDYLFILSLFVGLIARALIKNQSVILQLCVIGTVSALYVSSSVVSHNAPPHATPSTAVIMFHVIPSLIGEGALCILAVSSGIFLWREKALRKLQPTALNVDAPNLELLGKVMDKSSRYGFLALGASVASGVLWAWWESTPLVTFEITKVSALLIWVILGGVLLSKQVSAIPRRKVAVGCVAAGVLFCLALIINIVVRHQGIHG